MTGLTQHVQASPADIVLSLPKLKVGARTLIWRTVGLTLVIRMYRAALQEYVGSI